MLSLRRQLEGYDKPGNEIFDPSNPEGVKIREKVRDLALMDMFSWIEDEVSFKFEFILKDGILTIFVGRNCSF